MEPTRPQGMAPKPPTPTGEDPLMLSTNLPTLSLSTLNLFSLTLSSLTLLSTTLLARSSLNLPSINLWVPPNINLLVRPSLKLCSPNLRSTNRLVQCRTARINLLVQPSNSLLAKRSINLLAQANINPAQSSTSLLAKHSLNLLAIQLITSAVQSITGHNTGKSYLEGVFAPYRSQRVDLRENSPYAFIHFANVADALCAKLALENTEIFNGRGKCLLNWRSEPGSRARETAIVSHPVPGSGSKPQTNQFMAPPVPGQPMHQTAQVQYGQPVSGGSSQMSHGQAGRGNVPPQVWQQPSAGHQSHAPAAQPGPARGPSPTTATQAYGTQPGQIRGPSPMTAAQIYNVPYRQAKAGPVRGPSPIAAAQAYGAQPGPIRGPSPTTAAPAYGHQPGPIRGPSPIAATQAYGAPYHQAVAGSVRGPSPTTAAQAYSAPYRQTQPGLPIPGRRSSNEMEWAPSGNQGYAQGAYPIQNPVHRPPSASSGAYQQHGIAYRPGSTGPGDVIHGVGARAWSTGYSPPGADYQHGSAATSPQAATISARPFTQPAQQNPLQPTVNTESPLVPPVHRTSGIVQSPSTPTQPAAQPFQPRRNTEASSSAGEDVSSSFSEAQPTAQAQQQPPGASRTKKKKNRRKKKKGGAAAQGANTSSSIPDSSTSHNDLEVVALHAGLQGPSTKTVSEVESDAPSQSRDTQSSPAPRSYHSGPSIASDPVSHNLASSPPQPTSSRAESVLGSESCDTSGSSSPEPDKAAERVQQSLPSPAPKSSFSNKSINIDPLSRNLAQEISGSSQHQNPTPLLLRPAHSDHAVNLTSSPPKPADFDFKSVEKKDTSLSAMDSTQSKQGAAHPEPQLTASDKGKTPAHEQPSSSATEAGNEPQLNLVENKDREHAQKGKQASSSAADTGTLNPVVETAPANLDNSDDKTRGTDHEMNVVPMDITRDEGTDMSATSHVVPGQSQTVGHDNAAMNTEGADMSFATHINPDHSQNVGQDKATMATEVTGTSQTQVGSSDDNSGTIPQLPSMSTDSTLNLGNPPQIFDLADYLPPLPEPGADCDCPLTAAGHGHFCQQGRYTWNDFTAELEREAAAASPFADCFSGDAGMLSGFGSTGGPSISAPSNTGPDLDFIPQSFLDAAAKSSAGHAAPTAGPTVAPTVIDTTMTDVQAAADTTMTDVAQTATMATADTTQTAEMANADTNLTITYGTNTSVIRVDHTKLFPMEKWYGPLKENNFGKGKAKGKGKGKAKANKGDYDLTLDLTGSIPVLPIDWTEDEAVDAIKLAIRVMHQSIKKGDAGLSIKQVLLVHHMDSVLGLNTYFRRWLERSIDPHARDLTKRMEAGVPIAARDWEQTLLACHTLKYRVWFQYVAAALVRSSTLATTTAGKPVLKPTGDGLIDGAVCGEATAAALVEVRDEALRFVIGTANHGVSKYQRSKKGGSGACRACIGDRLGALMGAVGDLGLWPGKKPADLRGASLYALEKRMGEMAAGGNLSARVAKYAGVCGARGHRADGNKLFSIEDVACDIWDGIQKRVELDVGCHQFMVALFEQ